MSINIHPNQHAMAKELNIDVSEMASEEATINAVESLLGSASMEVRAQWFVVSVLRHLRKAKWADLTTCDLDAQSQRDLALRCLEVDGFATSLRTVTKDYRSKFRIVNFASSKNIGRGILATGTKAYKLAAQVIESEGLIKQAPFAAEKQLGNRVAAKAAPETAKPATPKQASKVGKQSQPAGKAPKAAPEAGRRGYASDELSNIAEAASRISDSNPDLAMSDEEFAKLDAQLNKSDAEIVQQNWGDQPGEERWSRILGILAGVGFLVFVALLFL